MAAKKTGQTGQPKAPWFEIRKDDEGKFQWAMWSPNGRIVAQSGGSFTLAKDAIASIKGMIEAVKTAELIVRAETRPPDLPDA